jgi:hypothetical protein
VKDITATALNVLTAVSGFDVRARVLTSFQTGITPTGTEVEVTGGQVIQDASADIRSVLDVTVNGYQKWPRFSGSLLAPYGNELFVERAVVYNNFREWIPLGYFRIDTPEQQIIPDGPIRIAATDRMSGIIDGKLTEPAQFLSTETFGSVVEELVTAVYPDAVIEWDDDTKDDTINRTIIAEEDRYKFLNDLVTSVGKIWYWDNRGVLVIKNVPSVDDPSVWTVSSGEGGVLVAMDRQLTRKGVYNAVVATGEAADTETPSRAIAYDNSPVSPTYYFGRFGPVPRFYSSPFLTTNAQCLSAARSILTKGLGLPYNINFSAVPNPALEPYDVVTIKYPTRQRSIDKFTETHVVDSITIPLTATSPITAATREQSLVLIGSET